MGTDTVLALSPMGCFVVIESDERCVIKVGHGEKALLQCNSDHRAWCWFPSAAGRACSTLAGFVLVFPSPSHKLAAVASDITSTFMAGRGGKVEEPLQLYLSLFTRTKCFLQKHPISPLLRSH